MNNTMTRVNGVFEKDFSARMVLIANNNTIIYTNAATDPYTGNLNLQLQQNLTAVIGNDNYDIGHIFNAAGNNGNAGCIGCVCVNPVNTNSTAKGSGFTQSTAPVGDAFDIDYVAHEMGHQFGGNHTFSMNIEGAGVNMEPGSGSTIMGYAGITNQNVQMNSDAFFHAVSIQQITNNIKNKTCPVVTNTGNAIPTADAGLDYTIPKELHLCLQVQELMQTEMLLLISGNKWIMLSSAQTGANSAASPTKATGQLSDLILHKQFHLDIFHR